MFSDSSIFPNIALRHLSVWSSQEDRQEALAWVGFHTEAEGLPYFGQEKIDEDDFRILIAYGIVHGAQTAKIAKLCKKYNVKDDINLFDYLAFKEELLQLIPAECFFLKLRSSRLRNRANLRAPNYLRF